MDRYQRCNSFFYLLLTLVASCSMFLIRLVNRTGMLGQGNLLRDEALDSAELLEPLFHPSSTCSQPEILRKGAQVKEVQLLRIENIAVPACYLVVGVVQGLSGPLLNVYPLDLGASEAAQVTLSTIVILPATIKIFYGFLSDSFPIRGSRRKPYMFLGWTTVSTTMLVLLFSTNLEMSYDKDGIPMPPSQAPSIEVLSGLFFFLGVGLWLADVMGDSLVVRLGITVVYLRQLTCKLGAKRPASLIYFALHDNTGRKGKT